MIGANNWHLTGILILLGAGWGLTQPLSKITVSAGYAPLGLVFWQLVVGVIVLGAMLYRRLGRIPVTSRTIGFWVLIAMLGTIVPNSASFRAIFHLPSGITSIVLSSIPMMAFPIAIALGNEQFSPIRLFGLVIGMVAVALIALPEASLPDRAMVAFLPLALIAPLCYALEGNIVARWGTAGLDPVEVLFGASVVGAIISLPLAISTGHFFVPKPPFQLADATMIASSVIHAVVYVSYVWLVGRAGAVFAGQVSYLVTGFGVIWAMMILGERYSLWIWAALALMLLGLLVVQPRPGVASRESAGDSNPDQLPGSK